MQQLLVPSWRWATAGTHAASRVVYMFSFVLNFSQLFEVIGDRIQVALVLVGHLGRIELGRHQQSVL